MTDEFSGALPRRFSLSPARMIASAALIAGAVTALTPVAAADAETSVTLTLDHHAFDHDLLTVPAGERITLIVVNQDASAGEFESNDLHIEKIIPGGGQVEVTVGPLEPGNYIYFDDFHQAARGILKVEAAS